MRRTIPFLAALLLTSPAFSQVIDRDITLVEPVTTEGGTPLVNLLQCTVEIADASPDGAGGVIPPETRVIPASGPAGGGTHTIDLTGKVGFTTVTAACMNTVQESGRSVSLTRTFPGDPPASPSLRD